MTRSVPALALGILVLGLASLHLGLRPVSPADVLRALTAADQDATALIVRTLRLPRTLLALAVGAALGVAGVLMQTAARNPIAEPGLLGVNAGAAFAVVLAVTAFGVDGFAALTAVAAGGAVAAAALVFGLATAGGVRLSPAHLLLAGVTVAALLSAGTQMVIVLDEVALEELLFWISGAFADRPLGALAVAGPVMALAALAAWAAAGTLDVLTTDDGTAEALGVPVRPARLTALAGAGLLAGASVAVAGPVAFIGLGAPHLARTLGARGHARLLPVAALWGAALALGADILARYVIWPGEAPISAVTALAGVPLLIWLLRRQRPRAA